jgi:hypothetical protein
MSWIVFILAVLAVFRVAWMVTHEEGPFAVFVTLRERIDPAQKSWLGRGLNCPNCVSFWLALVAALLIGGDWLLNWLGIAGAVLLINKAMNK